MNKKFLILIFILLISCTNEKNEVESKLVQFDDLLNNCTKISLVVEDVEALVNKRLVRDGDTLCGDFIVELFQNGRILDKLIHNANYENKIVVENANTLWYNSSSVVKINDEPTAAITYATNNALIRFGKLNLRTSNYFDNLDLHSFHKPDDHSSPSLIENDSTIFIVSSHHSSELILSLVNSSTGKLLNKFIIDNGLTTYPQIHKLNDEYLVIYREGFRGASSYKGNVSLTSFNEELKFVPNDSIIKPELREGIIFPFSKVLGGDLYIASTVYNPSKGRHEGVYLHKVVKDKEGYKAVNFFSDDEIIDIRVNDIGVINGKLFISLSKTSVEYSCCLENESLLYDVESRGIIKIPNSYTVYYSQAAKISNNGLIYQPIFNNGLSYIVVGNLNENYKFEVIKKIDTKGYVRELEIVDGFIKYIEATRYERYDDFNTNYVIRY